jgi:hypothetical protein
MTPDRRSRVLRTAIQAAVPALLLLLTTLTSLLQNLRDARNDTSAAALPSPTPGD